MSTSLRLESHLDHTAARTPALTSSCRAIEALAIAARQIARLLASGPLHGDLGAVIGDSLDGDGQKALDAITHRLIRDALAGAGVLAFASEEQAAAEYLDPSGDIAVAIDPLDGSSNIDTLAPLGTIFSILPALPARQDGADAVFLQPGRRQLAAASSSTARAPRWSSPWARGRGSSPSILSPAPSSTRTARSVCRPKPANTRSTPPISAIGTSPSAPMSAS
ncbi:unnamed protein product [Acidocella sp. C78]|uniref:hypothetical protein n=1 Tax=Acidocella sp. C78 TaxID=1671486 RepID=UPI001BC5D102|nr:hypothetical protein [Acidocella sp. C78]CAG4926758.1 unnamed protein product [Acidocella sp. C78]